MDEQICTTAHSVPCRACGNAHGNERYVMRERLFGLGHHFDYVRCAACGTRSIVTVPADLAAYYPRDQYYSFTPRRRTSLAARVRRWRNAGYFAGPLSPSRLVRALIPDPVGRLAALAPLLHDRDTRILDVGAGAGDLVDDLAALGFRSLTAIDPFLPHGAERRGPPVEVRRAELSELTGEHFDVVMLHHVIEHVPDPVQTLQEVAAVLAPGGLCLVRTPLADSWAADEYGECWIQHDAPRHLVVLTEAGLRTAASRAGLMVTAAWRDSTPLQFWGSEAYRRDERLVDVVAARRSDPIERFLSREGWRQWSRSRALNREGKGDQGAFVLRPVGARRSALGARRSAEASHGTASS